MNNDQSLLVEAVKSGEIAIKQTDGSTKRYVVLEESVYEKQLLNRETTGFNRGRAHERQYLFDLSKALVLGPDNFQGQVEDLEALMKETENE